MTWQLWVLIGTAVVCVVVLVTARFRSAQQVLDELIDSVEPHTGARAEQQQAPAKAEQRPEVAARRGDELARHRGRHHLRTTFVPRTAHSYRSRH
jgi:hypothetical protein